MSMYCIGYRSTPSSHDDLGDVLVDGLGDDYADQPVHKVKTWSPGRSP